jgi:hypothetical protein
MTPPAETKPLRIFATDHAPLRLVAEMERRSPAEIVHEALNEYLRNHRDRLVPAFDGAQAAIASGDLDRLSAHLAQMMADDAVREPGPAPD